MSGSVEEHRGIADAPCSILMYDLKGWCCTIDLSDMQMNINMFDKIMSKTAS